MPAAEVGDCIPWQIKKLSNFIKTIVVKIVLSYPESTGKPQHPDTTCTLSVASILLLTVSYSTLKA